MKKLLLFESFVEKLYEIKFTGHWKERSAIPTEDNANQSRIQQYSNRFRYGWALDGLIDNRRNPVDINGFLQDTNLDEETLKREIVQALRVLTRSLTLERWSEPNTRYQLLDLGKIAVYNGDKNAYPLFGTKNEEKGIVYDSAEGVWGIAEKNEGITFMYYPANKEGAELFYSQARRSSNLRDLDFLQSSNFFSPYGQGFKLIIDATDPSPVSRARKLEMQVRGQKIELGPEPERDFVPVQTPDPTRKTISPGDEIEYIVKFIDGEKFLKGRILDIFNMEDIKKAQRTKSLSGIQDIKVRFLPYEPEKVGMKDDQYKKEQEKYTRNDSGEILPVTISLKDGSIFISDGVKYKILGPTKGKPLVTAEPSIINAGNVQTWVQETK